MIPGIENVTHIISHKNCPDGIASALICSAALPHAKVSFVMYGESEYEQHALPNDFIRDGDPYGTSGEVQLWVDIIPPKSRAKDFADTGRCIVLDHHKGAQDIVALFGERGRFADEAIDVGVSGALLAYEHVYEPLRGVPEVRTFGGVWDFACLTGIRDTWQTQSPDWDRACAQAEYLTLMGYDALNADTHVKGLLSVWERDERFKVGAALVRRTRESAMVMAKGAYHMGRFAITNTRYASDFAEALREIDDPADVAVSFAYVFDNGKPSIVFSLRTIRGVFDCAAFAKTVGGGGHTKAAGFTIKGDAVSTMSPFVIFREVSNAFESSNR